METMEAPVRAVRTVGPDAVALELSTPTGFEALPGQFVLVRADLDGEQRSRHYTISSSEVADTFELTVGIDPEGTLSPWLAEREPGEAITIEGPFGNVAYDAAIDGDVVVLAGGPGVGPAVGVAEAAVDAGHAAAVVYEDDRPIHEDRLAGLAAAGADVRVVSDGSFPDAVAAVVGGTTRSADDETTANSADDETATNPADDETATNPAGDEGAAESTDGDAGVYVFGFQPFVERARDALAVAGVDPDDAGIESFG